MTRSLWYESTIVRNIRWRSPEFYEWLEAAESDESARIKMYKSPDSLRVYSERKERI